MQYVTLLKERQMNVTLLPKIEISNAILSPRLSLLEFKSNIKRIKANWLHFLGDLCHSRNSCLPRWKGSGFWIRNRKQFKSLRPIRARVTLPDWPISIAKRTLPKCELRIPRSGGFVLNRLLVQATFLLSSLKLAPAFLFYWIYGPPLWHPRSDSAPIAFARLFSGPYSSYYLHKCTPFQSSWIGFFSNKYCTS